MSERGAKFPRKYAPGGGHISWEIWPGGIIFWGGQISWDTGSSVTTGNRITQRKPNPARFIKVESNWRKQRHTKLLFGRQQTTRTNISSVGSADLSLPETAEKNSTFDQ